MFILWVNELKVRVLIEDERSRARSVATLSRDLSANDLPMTAIQVLYLPQVRSRFNSCRRS